MTSHNKVSNFRIPQATPLDPMLVFHFTIVGQYLARDPEFMYSNTLSSITIMDDHPQA
jgi:hypothetical protein